MRSVTSYFNPTLYKKNLSRFWPLWASWTVLWLFVGPFDLLSSANLSGAMTAQDAEYALWRFYYQCVRLPNQMAEMGLLLGAAFAVVCAMAVFGYLFNHRAAATIHALPMRRETLFVTNWLSGLTFLIVPNLLVMGCTVLVELVLLPGNMSAQTIPFAVAWFWAKCGVELFFFSFAVFCAQFTGSILALPAFYGILNVLVLVMYELIVALADSIYFGFANPSMPDLVEYLTPVYALMRASSWSYTSWGQIMLDDNMYQMANSAQCHFYSAGTIAVYAAIGIALSAAALLLYRKRHIESAGDVVSVKVVRPIFRAGVAVCAGLSGGILTWAFFGWSGENELAMVACMLVWTVVGYFAAEMLLQKSFRVFQAAWKGCAALTLVCGLVFVGMLMDVLGIQTKVPDGGNVETAYIDIYSTYPYDEASNLHLEVEDPAMVEEIVDLHQAIVDNFKEYGEFWEGDDYTSFHVMYTLKDGTTINREYSGTPILRSGLVTPGEPAYHLNRIVNDPEMIRLAYGLDTAEQGIISYVTLENVELRAGVDTVTVDAGGAREIWQAVQADFAAGNLGKRHLFDDEVRRVETYYSDLNLFFLLPETGDEPGVMYYEDYISADSPVTQSSERSWNLSLTVTLTPYAEHTLKALEEYTGLGSKYDLITHAEHMAEEYRK